MPNLLYVPEYYHRVNTNCLGLANEGPHHVKVMQIDITSEKQVDVRFQCLEGDEKGIILSRMYLLDNHYGINMFKQFMESIGVVPGENNALDLDGAIDRELIVTVAHRTHDGVTYNNVVSHQPNA